MAYVMNEHWGQIIDLYGMGIDGITPLILIKMITISALFYDVGHKS